MKKAGWKNWTGLVLSVLVVLMPFLGFPNRARNFFFIIFGIVLACLFFSLASDISSLINELTVTKLTSKKPKVVSQNNFDFDKADEHDEATNL